MPLDPSAALHTRGFHTALERGNGVRPLRNPAYQSLLTSAPYLLLFPAEPQSKTMTLANQLTFPPKLTVAIPGMPSLGMTTTSFTS